MPADSFLTIRDVAALFQVSPKTVRKWIKDVRGFPAPFQMNGKTSGYRWDPNAFNSYRWNIRR